MTDISALEAYAGQLSEAAALSTAAAQKHHEIINGDALTDVLVESGLVPTQAKQAVLAQEKVTAALEEVASQLSGSMTFTTTAKGLLATQPGGLFGVLSPSNKEYVLIYENVANVAVPTGKSYPSTEAVESAANSSSTVTGGLLRALIDASTPDAFSRGSYSAGTGVTVPSTIFGWRSPFKHNGAPFNAIQFTAKAAAANIKLRVEILSSTFVVLAHGFAYTGVVNETLTVVFDRMVTELAVDQIAYIGYSSDSKLVGAGHPAGGAYTDVDPNVYREQYYTAGWGNVAGGIGAYRVQFRLLDTTKLTRSIAAEVATLNTQVPLKVSKTAANKIAGAVVPYVVWSPVLGDAEMVGDSTYTTPKLSGFSVQATDDTLFNAIAGRVWCTSSAAAIEWRVWIRDNRNAFNLETEVAQASGTIAAGNFPTSNSLYTLTLGTPLFMAKDKWVFVMFRASNDAAVSSARWLYNAAASPQRIGLPFVTAAGWNNTLLFGTVTSGYGQVAPKLLLESEELRLKPSGSAATTGYNGAGSGLAAVTVQAAIDELAAGAPEIVLPPFVFGLQGKECNVYLDNLHLADASEYHHDVTASADVPATRQQNERFTWIPTGAVAAGTLTVAVHDKRTGKLLTSKTAQQRAAAASAGTGQTKKVLVVGDSLIVNGTITQTLLDLAAADPMKIELLGTLGAGLNKHEGRGGWTVDNYTSAGIVNYRFTVSGVVETPAINSAEYSHNGAVYRVQETSLVGGTGTITCSVVSGGAPLASGTLTKTNGASGDASIAFSASTTLSGNPFWFSGAVNFAQYLSTNAISVPDWVIPGLGINDVFSLTTDAAVTAAVDAALIKMDTLIASIKAADSSVRVGLMIPTPPSSDQDSFGANYFTGQTRWRFKRNILIWARQMIAKYSGQEASRIYLIPTNTALDTINNMSRAAAAPANSRTTVTVARQNNGVHPSSAGGYQQLADAIMAFIKYFA